MLIPTLTLNQTIEVAALLRVYEDDNDFNSLLAATNILLKATKLVLVNKIDK